jgi:hypothetical protein
MRTILIIGALSIGALPAVAQTVEVIKQSNFVKTSDDKDFSFIEPATDLHALQHVATIKVSGSDKEASTELLYFKAKRMASELGANSFTLNNYNQTENPPAAVLVLDLYYGSDSTLEANFARHEKNVVYLFGSDRKSTESYSYKVNSIKQELKAGSFARYELTEEQEQLKINKGGMTGATMWLKWQENKPATFLTLTGFGLGGGEVPYGTVGMSFNTGRIYTIDGNLGHLLVQLMSKK